VNAYEAKELLEIVEWARKQNYFRLGAGPQWSLFAPDQDDLRKGVMALYRAAYPDSDPAAPARYAQALAAGVVRGEPNP
jgi:hypothetical protein